MTQERIVLSQINDPSTEVAFKLDANGKWMEAANHFFTLAEAQADPELKSQHLIDLTQMLINLEEFDQAQDTLAQIDQVTPQIQARVYEKHAWIADYEGRFEEELELLRKAKELTPDSDKNLLSTINHFMGRAHVGLATQGIDKDKNVSQARSLFEKDLKKAAASRNTNPAGEAFALLWIAKCDLLGNRLGDARRRLPVIQGGFENHKRAHPESGIESTYYLIKGDIELAEGDLAKARTSYENALEIQVNTENHPRTMAEARAGIAKTN